MENQQNVYQGNLPHIYVGFSYRDEQQAQAIIQGLQQRGYRVFFDQGIQAGSDWSCPVIRHLNNCTVFLPVLTRNFMRSQNCVQELHYALAQGLPILPIYLEDLTSENCWEMPLNKLTSLWYTASQDDSSFWKAICSSEILNPCLNKPSVTPAKQSSQLSRFVMRWFRSKKKP